MITALVLILVVLVAETVHHHARMADEARTFP